MSAKACECRACDPHCVFHVRADKIARVCVQCGRGNHRKTPQA